MWDDCPDGSDEVGCDFRFGYVWIAATALVSLALGWVLGRYTDAALPMIDSAVAGMSISAQFLLSFRRIENWVLWIVIDVVAIGLYINRGLDLLAVLYAGFLILSVIGLREWIRSQRLEAA